MIRPSLHHRPGMRCMVLAAVALLWVWPPSALGAFQQAPRSSDTFAIAAGMEPGLSAAPRVTPPVAPTPAAGAVRGIIPAGGGGAVAPAGLDFLARGLLALGTLPVLVWFFRRQRRVNRIEKPGFEVISPSEMRQFIALEERFHTLDFVNSIKTRGALRLSANLNKVTLSQRRFGTLMADKNIRNALLVNRRRVRRTLLRNGDVLDLGDLTLLYRDHRETQIIRHASITPADGKSQIRFDRPNGPVRKGVPMLISDQLANRPFYMTKNVVFIGRSESNDLVIKSRAVYYRHAKIDKVGGRYKLQDLSKLGNTFVNNRRVEQRFLKDGDEISIENHRFKFQLVTRFSKDRPPVEESAPSTADEEPAFSGEDSGDGMDDNEAAASS